MSRRKKPTRITEQKKEAYKEYQKALNYNKYRYRKTFQDFKVGEGINQEPIGSILPIQYRGKDIKSFSTAREIEKASRDIRKQSAPKKMQYKINQRLDWLIGDRVKEIAKDSKSKDVKAKARALKQKFNNLSNRDKQKFIKIVEGEKEYNATGEGNPYRFVSTVEEDFAKDYNLSVEMLELHNIDNLLNEI